MERSGKVAIPWAPRGPVLTPLNFIIWGNVKISKPGPFERKVQKAAEIHCRVYGKEWNTDWKYTDLKMHIWKLSNLR